MKMKKVTSLVMLITGFLGLVTSIVLYIVPQGRVAYWSGWKLLGLSKSQWGELHINLGFFFILASILHIYFNWALITAYLKNKAKEFKMFTVEFNIALFLTLVVSFGTYFSVPPFSTIIDFGESFKDGAEEKYGTPPYGHAELSSLKGFTRRMQIDLAAGITALQKAGVSVVGEQQTILAIAKSNKMTPEQVYNIIKNKEKTNAGTMDKRFPDSPQPGFGKMPLSKFSSKYKLNMDEMLEALEEKGIKASPEQSIKEIAANNESSPMAIFEILQHEADKK